MVMDKYVLTFQLRIKSSGFGKSLTPGSISKRWKWGKVTNE